MLVNNANWLRFVFKVLCRKSLLRIHDCLSTSTLVKKPKFLAFLYCFWCVPVGVSIGVCVGIRFFISVHYLLNQWMDFEQTCIDTLLGGGEEMIRLWWPWPYFQGHRGTLKCPKYFFCASSSKLVDGFWISYRDSLGHGNLSLFKWSWWLDQDGGHALIW